MSTKTAIEWTEVTWNPVTGCTKISPGCKNCYAERMALRLQKMGQQRYKNGFNVSFHPESLKEPFLWKRPKTVFVNSMSDLFHESISADYIRQVFQVMRACSQHQFQILTKRSKRLKDLSFELDWTPNIWMGVSVENERYKYRIDDLRSVPSFIRFLSIEPLIGPIRDLNLNGINWVIVGGESGPGSRVMKEEWVRSILNSCRSQNVAFFFKQWGGINKKKTGRLLDNREWNEMPSVAVTQSELF